VEFKVRSICEKYHEMSVDETGMMEISNCVDGINEQIKWKEHGGE
jgi:hypothetical protein